MNDFWVGVVLGWIGCYLWRVKFWKRLYKWQEEQSRFWHKEAMKYLELIPPQ